MNKMFLLLIITLLFPLTLFSQNVLNGDFENWTNQSPDNWGTNNVPLISFVPVSQSSTAQSGSSSLKGAITSYSGGMGTPILQAGLGYPLPAGFPVTQKFKTVSGWYQYNPVQGDKFSGSILMFSGANQIGYATFEITTPASSWTQFSLDFNYFVSGTPDKCKFLFTIDGPVTGDDFHLGSYFLLDNVVLSGIATSVNDKNIVPSKFSLEQNYPNPFNPSTKIQYNLPEKSFVNITVYNSIGREVTSLVNSVMPAGSHEIVFNASGLNSGVYFYTIKTGNNVVQTRKMILMK
jgi:hypothetical protein